jgi:hypothetical protein
MMRLAQFLNEKNHFLEKFYSLNEGQIERMQKGLFDDLEEFYNKREDLLKIIKYVDAEIYKAHQIHKEMSIEFSELEKRNIREALKAKEVYAKNILEQDLVILGMIDMAKSEIIKELKGIQKSKKALQGYKPTAA